MASWIEMKEKCIYSEIPLISQRRDNLASKTRSIVALSYPVDSIVTRTIEACAPPPSPSPVSTSFKIRTKVRQEYEESRERRRKFDVAHYGRNINTLAEEEEEEESSRPRGSVAVLHFSFPHFSRFASPY